MFNEVSPVERLETIARVDHAAFVANAVETQIPVLRAARSCPTWNDR